MPPFNDASAPDAFPPRSLDDVVGHRPAVGTIKRRFERNSHEVPLLIYGPDGVGKRTLARLYAKALLCEQPTSSWRSCNCCTACTAFAEGHSFAFAEFDAEKISDPRTFLREKMAQRSLVDLVSTRRVFVIRDFQRAKPVFADALLKPLEDGVAGATVILLADDFAGVRAAGRSRCMVSRLKALPAEEMRQLFLRMQATLCSRIIDESAVDAVVFASAGLPSRAYEICTTLESSGVAGFEDAKRVLALDWGSHAIRLGATIFNLSGDSGQVGKLIEGVPAATISFRIRLLLVELAKYLTGDETAQTSRHFEIFDPGEIRKLVADLRAKSLEIGRAEQEIWFGVTEIFLRELYQERIGLTGACREASSLTRTLTQIDHDMKPL